MLSLGCYNNKNYRSHYHPLNWESNISDISLKSCDIKDDPSGYNVIFYANKIKEDNNKSIAYVIGASLLYNRLRKLNNAGFDAPMTQKAINMLERKASKILSN